MNFLHHMLKKHRAIALGVLSVLILLAIYISSTVRATGPFTAGTELDPDCIPGAVDCIVTAGGGSQWLDSAPDIYFDAGKVAIGTSSPEGDFDVFKDQDASTAITLRNPNTGPAANVNIVTSSDSAILGLGSASTGFTGIPAFAGNSFVYEVFNDLVIGAGTDVIFSTLYPGVTERMRILQNGNVGIDTTNPVSLLQIGEVNDTNKQYLQIDSDTSSPNGSDCDATNETGRMYVKAATLELFVCFGTAGWSSIAFP